MVLILLSLLSRTPWPTFLGGWDEGGIRVPSSGGWPDGLGRALLGWDCLWITGFVGEVAAYGARGLFVGSCASKNIL